LFPFTLLIVLNLLDFTFAVYSVDRSDLDSEMRVVMLLLVDRSTFLIEFS